MPKFLLVEDDPLVARIVVDWLESENHTVEHTDNGADGESRLKHYLYDVAILDWQLPERSGVDICAGYRSRGGKTPILMLTGQSTLDHKERGLDAGADDYLTKPFHIRELAARVRALLRRPFDMMPSIGLGSSLTLDPKDCSVTRMGTKTELNPRDFAVFEFLYRHAGQFYPSDQLLNQVWSSESDSTLNALRSSVKRLRQQLEVEGTPRLIESARNQGYRVVLNSKTLFDKSGKDDSN